MDPAQRISLDNQALSLQQCTATANASIGDHGARRIEFSSRGDRVPALLMVPDGTAPHPVVVLVHAAGSAKDTAAMQLGGKILAAGIALLTLDLPLHGERRSQKLTEELLATLHQECSDANAASLLRQFVLQSENDVRCALDAVSALPELAEDRIGLAGIGHGGLIATRVASSDPRPRALAVSDPPDPPLPSELDTSADKGRMASRPFTQIESISRDEAALADFFRDELP